MRQRVRLLLELTGGARGWETAVAARGRGRNGAAAVGEGVVRARWKQREERLAAKRISSVVLDYEMGGYVRCAGVTYELKVYCV